MRDCNCLSFYRLFNHLKKKVEDRMKEIERGRTAHKKQTRIKYITHSACPRNKRSQKLSGGNEILKSFLLLGKTFPHILIYIYLQAEVVLLWVCSKFELSLNTFTTIFFRDFLFVVVGLHVNLIWPCTFCHCLFVCAKREREITLYSMAFEIRIQMKLPQSNCQTLILNSLRTQTEDK